MELIYNPKWYGPISLRSQVLNPFHRYLSKSVGLGIKLKMAC